MGQRDNTHRAPTFHTAPRACGEENWKGQTADGTLPSARLLCCDLFPLRWGCVAVAGGGAFPLHFLTILYV